MGAGSVLLEARSLCTEADLDVLDSSDSLEHCLDSGQAESALWRLSNVNG